MNLNPYRIQLLHKSYNLSQILLIQYILSISSKMNSSINQNNKEKRWKMYQPFDEKLIEMRNKEFKAIHTQTHIHFNIVRVVMIPYLLISSLSIFWEHFCILPLFKSILHISNNLSFRSKFNSYPSILLFHLKFDDVKQSWSTWSVQINK